jgi:GNAT superfamily N-acetyltransferase
VIAFDPVLELAENANTYTPLGPAAERVLTDRYVLWSGAGVGSAWNAAQRFRFQPEALTEVRSEIHAHLRKRGRSACSWEVGSSAQPRDLVDRLLALGLVDDGASPVVGMALTGPPGSPAPAGIDVRRAGSDADELVAAEIAATVFGGSELVARPFLPNSPVVTYLASIDGRPVGRATGAFSAHGVTLFGGATLPEARGRGVYRALVHARLEDAAARRTPVAVTQAGHESRPILERLGFREVCRIRVLIDDFGRG